MGRRLRRRYAVRRRERFPSLASLLLHLALRNCSSAWARLSPRNDLEPVATLRAEYRDVGEAGVLTLSRSDLLVANSEAGRAFVTSVAATAEARYWQVLDDASSVGEAKAGLLALAADYERSYPSAARVLSDDVEQLVAHLRFPLVHRKRTRSTNLLDRTFVEVRRRTKVIGRFPGETSALSLIWAVLELSSRGWRGVEMTPKTVAESNASGRRVTSIDLTTDNETKEIAAA